MWSVLRNKKNLEFGENINSQYQLETQLAYVWRTINQRMNMQWFHLLLYSIEILQSFYIQPLKHI